MITRKNWTLLVLGVVICSAYGAPLNGTNIDLNAALSDQTRWPFLMDCVKDSETKDEFLCPEYSLAKENVSKCISDVNDAKIFSTPVETFGNMSYFCNVIFIANRRNVTIIDDLQKKCELVCIEKKVQKQKIVEHIKPFCRYISWIRSNCSTEHDITPKETSAAIQSEKDVHTPDQHISLPQAASSGINPINTQTAKNKTTTSNPSESAQKNPQENGTQQKKNQHIESPQEEDSQGQNLPKKTPQSENLHNQTAITVKSKTTTASFDRAKIEGNVGEYPVPPSDVKSNETKTTVALPSTPTKKSSVTTGNTSAETSLKAQDDDPIAVNSSEQNNSDDAEQDEPSKIGDGGSYDDTGNLNEYPNVDPLQKKPDLEQDSNIAVGKEWMAPKSKAHSYFLEPEDSGSNFFSYFLFGMFLCIFLYVVYHNKSKILALVLEGRRTSSSRSGSKRKHTAAYRKLDTNLEEAITSSASGRTSQIIY